MVGKELTEENDASGLRAAAERRERRGRVEGLEVALTRALARIGVLERGGPRRSGRVRGVSVAGVRHALCEQVMCALLEVLREHLLNRGVHVGSQETHAANRADQGAGDGQDRVRLGAEM